MKKLYNTPELFVVTVMTKDVITVSLTNGGENGEAALEFSLEQLL